MKYKKVINILLLLIVCLTTFNVYAQTNYANVRVDSLTDAQIRQMIQQAASIGYNDEQMEHMAEIQGMPPEDVRKLKARVDKIKRQDNNLGAASTNGNSLNGRLYNFNDSVNNPQSTDNSQNLTTPKIFGEDLFKNSRASFEPNLRLATPKGYVIGPDDELLVDINGDNEASYTLKVSPEGTVRLQYVGIIPVSGLTIEQATSKIRNSMAKTYPGLLSGRTNVAINLGNIRSIKITFVGEAVKPGSYTLPSLATAFNALSACGGPNRNGSYRKIQVIRNNKVVSTIDVYNFLLKGFQNNIRLQDQDVINIPVYQTRVEISGEVKRPALYEVLNTESLQDVINFAGSFSSLAYTANIKILQNTNKERKIIDIDAANFINYKPLNGDSYIVETILNRFENRVTIQGAVFRPGLFELDKGLTLRGLITKANGLKEDAFLNRGYILRLNADNTQSLLSFDVGGLLRGTAPDIDLQREDKVTISSIFDLRDEYKVEVQGEVRNPGTFAFAENTSLESAIQMAGGFKEGATPNRIEISRRVKNSDAKSATAAIAQIFTVNIDRNLKLRGEPFILQPFDIVSVRGSEGYEVQKLVKVEGEVLYPGTYTIERKDEKISDIVKRAGGLTAMAFPEGASLKRSGPTKATIRDSTGTRDKNTISRADQESERLINLKRLQQQQGINIINVDTASFRQDPSIVRSDLVGINLNQILEKPYSRNDLLLEDGDVIRVPKELQTVRVSGEVLKPTNIIYKPGRGISRYIIEAGGFTYNAIRRNIYVQYANGSIKATKKFILFRKYPKIIPGAEVFVPKRPAIQGIGLQGIVGITSALTSLAVIIVALFKK